MNRYDHAFRMLPALVRVNAAQKVGFARGGIIQHRANGFGPEDDDAIVRQFDLSGMAEFWGVVLSEPMECADFAHALAIHFMVIEHTPGGTDSDRLASGPAARRVVDAVRAQLLSALRRARIDGEPWFMDAPEPPPSTKLDAKAWLGFVPSDTFMAPPDPPPDGIDLSKLKVQPRPAVDWLIAMPKRRHLVPPSLVAMMALKSETNPATDIPSVDRMGTVDQHNAALSDAPEPIKVARAQNIHEIEPPFAGPKHIKLAKLNPKRKRGRRAQVGPRVEAEMRAAIQQGDDLGGMSQYEMSVRFKASESLCRDIRSKTLGQGASDTNSA